ncbi:hypothetical protein [uncultured Rheinheimera sp.]|uniref:hypothetical protein n=1 Tax=uncultured Rheinheimera sp. TaxID=400532 RepID=UPI002599AAED|nr:hypothetical protein [uncultured Rheinheimera sp.]
MSNKDLIYEKITALFADDSMPPMILLDGKWGCGKSHYVTQTLKPKLEKVNGNGKRQKVLYFSVYGISDLDDFRDKLISAYYLKDENTSDLLTPLANLTVALGKHVDAEKGGLAATFLSGFKGIAKHSLLSRLSDFILILDDLERVSGADLCEQILAECLEFSASTERNVKVIAVGNSERIPKLDSFLNKVFIDQLIFSRSVDDLFNIAFDRLAFDTVTEKNIKKLITDLKLKNLRILNRAANKLAPLIQEINNAPDMDVPNASTLVASQMITLCHVHYELSESYEAINDSLASNPYMSLPNIEPFDESIEPATITKLQHILSSVENASDALVRYACGEVFTATIGDFGQLPMKSRPLDKLFYNFVGRLSDEDFMRGFEELLQYIQKKEDVECKRWFFCIDFLDNLIAKRYVSVPRFIGANPLSYAKNEWGGVCFLNTEPDFSYRGRFTNKDISALLKEVLNVTQKKQNDIFFDNLKIKMQDSWSNVDTYIYKKWESKPFFNLLPDGLLKECLTKWTHNDVCIFTGFLMERYDQGGSIIANYIAETDFWIMFTAEINDVISEEPPSLKIGSLTELLTVVDAIQVKLNNKYVVR